MGKKNSIDLKSQLKEGPQPYSNGFSHHAENDFIVHITTVRSSY